MFHVKQFKIKYKGIKLDNTLENLLKKYNVSENLDILNKFDIYYKDLIEYNNIHNLTAITEKNEVNIKHFLDSVLPYSIFTKNAKIVDIGCGAGFPSIPLKIVRNDLHFVDIDSVNKKVEFVKNEINNLNLDNFEAIHTRIEDFAHNKDFRESFDYVVSRAVAPLNIILEYSAPLLKNNGYIISYKGANFEEELKLCENAMKKLNCILDRIEKFYIDELDTYRYILIIKKTKKIDNIYPRPKNKPRLMPL